MFHTPAHKQTDPAKAPGQLTHDRIADRTTVRLVPIEEFERIAEQCMRDACAAEFNSGNPDCLYCGNLDEVR